MPTIKNYLSLIKFSHTIFALPFALIGFFLGITSLKEFPNTENVISYYPKTNFEKIFLYFSHNWQIFILIIFSMVTARSAAMAFNRYLDKKFDAKNPRTAIREIPSGIISSKNALIFTIIMCLVFIVCAYLINKICFYLSPVALFVILFYSYTKRFTFLCHLVLGIGLSLAPIGAYLAVTGTFAWLPILFSIAVVCWVAGFDIIFALQDEAFDKENNLYSMPSFFGKAKALHISEVLHIIAALAICRAGYYGQFGWIYWIGAVVFCGMLFYQHAIVKPNDLSKVNIAFMTANGIASVVFGVLVILDILVLN